MTTKKHPSEEPSAYAQGPDDVGKPVGPEHDKSFSAPDFYDPVTGERIETAWDTDAQKNLPPQPPVAQEEPVAPPAEETPA